MKTIMMLIIFNMYILTFSSRLPLSVFHGFLDELYDFVGYLVLFLK